MTKKLVTIEDFLGMVSRLQEKTTPMLKGVLFKKDDFGREIKIAENTVVIGGAIAALEKLFLGEVSIPGSDDNWYKGGITLNQMLNINASTHTNTDPTSTETERVLVGYFGVGLTGAGKTFGEVNTPNFKNNALDDDATPQRSPHVVLTGSSSERAGMLPIKFSTDTTSTEYFMQREETVTTTGNQYQAYYLKKIDSVSLIVDDEDSTSHDAIYGENSAEAIRNSSGLIEAYAECHLKLTTNDVRDYFAARSELSEARYNTIGLFIGPQRDETDDTELTDVRLFSYVNFNNVSVVDAEETEYIYRVYAAI